MPYVLGLVKESNTALDVQRKAAETLATITSRTDLLGKMIKHGMVRNLCLMPSNPTLRPICSFSFFHCLNGVTGQHRSYCSAPIDCLLLAIACCRC